jgi:type VI secretion system protein ImpE
MPTASEHFHAGRLSDAVSAAIDAVKAAPADRGKRWLLAELLAVAGDTERADKHFDFLTTGSEKPELSALLGRQLLRAETARREVFTQGRVPEFLTQPPDHAKLSLEALIALRDGKAEEALAKLNEAEAARPTVSGTFNGTAFTGLRDLDDITAGVFEVFTSHGNYYWVPFETVELVECRAPSRPKDLLWRSCHMIVKDGPDGEVYLPALYPGSHSAAEDDLKMGRRTSYTDTAPVRGTGLRELLIGDGVHTLMEVETLTFGG